MARLMNLPNKFLLLVVVLVASLDGIGIGVDWTGLVMGTVPLTLERQPEPLDGVDVNGWSSLLTNSSCVFLAHSRRFGKSLLVTTREVFFQGEVPIAPCYLNGHSPPQTLSKAELCCGTAVADTAANRDSIRSSA